MVCSSPLNTAIIETKLKVFQLVNASTHATLYLVLIGGIFRKNFQLRKMKITNEPTSVPLISSPDHKKIDVPLDQPLSI
jgi:hypothetical protein